MSYPYPKKNNCKPPIFETMHKLSQSRKMSLNSMLLKYRTIWTVAHADTSETKSKELFASTNKHEKEPPKMNALEITAECGTLEQIVESLFCGDFNQAKYEYIERVLLCLPLFCSSRAFWDLFVVIAEGGVKGSPFVSPAHVILTIWLDLCFTRDFSPAKSGSLLKKLLAFLATVPPTVANRHKLQIVKYSRNVARIEQTTEIQKKGRKSVADKPETIKKSDSGSSVRGAYSMSIWRTSLEDFNLQTLAEQITCYEHKIFRGIPEQAWLGGKDWEKTFGIEKLTSHFNATSSWLISEILRYTDLEARAKSVSKCIQLLQNFYTLNNFHGVMLVVSTLNRTPILRLKKTWAHVTAAQKKTLADMEELMSNKHNFKNYRLLLGTNLPAMPYVGLIQRDVTFATETPNIVGENLVNLHKVNTTGTRIQNTRKLQKTTYEIACNVSISNEIDTMTLVDDEILYDRSVLCEPLE